MAELIKQVSEQKSFQELTFGDAGFVFVSGADPSTAFVYRAITALTEATITVTQKQLGTTYTIVLPVGATIYGQFSLIASVAGDIVCYLG